MFGSEGALDGPKLELGRDREEVASGVGFCGDGPGEEGTGPGELGGRMEPDNGLAEEERRRMRAGRGEV